jgi:hypothetical protein
MAPPLRETDDVFVIRVARQENAEKMGKVTVLLGIPGLDFKFRPSLP